jgi:hypothetical protein
MSIPSYVKGYPPDGSTLGQTKSTIRNNLDGTFQTLAVDHVNNNGDPNPMTNPPGYHRIIHEVPQATVTTVAGYNQVFSGVPGTLTINAVTTPNIPSGDDQQLYSLTGGGILSQLTGHSAMVNGYQWLGGVLLQWGSGSGNTPVVFPVIFPHAAFIAQITANGNARTWNVSSLTASGFTPVPSTGGGGNFYWLAIGY